MCTVIMMLRERDLVNCSGYSRVAPSSGHIAFMDMTMLFGLLHWEGKDIYCGSFLCGIGVEFALRVIRNHNALCIHMIMLRIIQVIKQIFPQSDSRPGECEGALVMRDQADDLHMIT